ncbi:MAG: PAS domain S-box protein [Candidatus Ozemobacteraceae bacterium]
MNKENNQQEKDQVAAIRQRAEEMAREKATLSPEETRQMLVELRVHQIELEMQNEELNRAQTELDRVRARYFDLYDVAPVGYCTNSRSGLILEANLTAAVLLGMTRGTLVNQPLSRFILNEDQDIYYKYRRQLFATGEPQACEVRMVKADGTLFWAYLTAAAARDDNGKPVCRVVISDITTRKKAEAALQQAHDELEQRVTARTKELWQVNEALKAASRYSRNLIEACLDPLVTISADGKITDVNLATEKATGIHRGKLIGSDFLIYFTEPESARAAYMKAFKQGQVIDYPLSLRHTSGTITEVLYNASVYRNEQGEIIGVFASARDITARKLAEAEKEKLETQNRQLHKSESLGRMAGAIAHHFNNQLQVVSGNLEMAMIEVARKPEKSIEFLTDALWATRRASEVSSLMLTYLGQTPGKREPLDLSEICLHNLPMLTAAMPKSVAMESDIPSPGPVVNADRNQIQQILANLIVNAWEAVANASSIIQVSVKIVSPSDISEFRRFPVDSSIQSGEYACLEVADTGCGISAKDIDNIFDPFFSTKFTGRGLGLPSVLGIVRSHEGFITVESIPGRGSTFRVYLPLTEEEIARSNEKFAHATDTQWSGTVLLAEDEEMVRDLTVMVLNSMGFEVLIARDGVEAVEVFRLHQHKIRCVLCDLTMPRLNGWETLTALRRLSPGIPVILASGYSEAQVMEGDHPERPQAFLGKPYQQEQLCDAIRRALAGENNRISGADNG